MSDLGKVLSVRRYPVKSMAGEELEAAHLCFGGLQGDAFDLANPEFASALEKRWNRKVAIRSSERPMHDARPVSIFSSATLRALEIESGLSLDPRRFRPNFYVEWKEAPPLFEESLLGRTLQIGDTARILLAKKNTRCVIITVDPLSAATAPQVLKTVGREHGGQLGVYAVVVQEGIVRRGDPIQALDGPL